MLFQIPDFDLFSFFLLGGVTIKNYEVILAKAYFACRPKAWSGTGLQG